MIENKIFNSGFKAQRDGYRPSDNPYIRGTEFWKDWRKGWEEAFKDLSDIDNLETSDQLINRIKDIYIEKGVTPDLQKAYDRYMGIFPVQK